MAPEDETVRLNYIQDSDIFLRQKPYEVVSEPPPGLAKNNFELKPGPPETIYDIRGKERQFNLDDNGFQVVHTRLAVSHFDEESITAQYIPAVENLLKTIEPGIEVYVFDWTLRSSELSNLEPGARVDLNDPMLRLRPVQAVHIDQSTWGAKKYATTLLGSEASAMGNKRIRIINVWRPLQDPVVNYPLAICDGSTVVEKDLLEVDHIRKHRISESLYPLQNDQYRWYYLNHQAPDEILLFKIYDSKEDVRARRCPHTSFTKEKISASARPRQSIELRVLVVSPC